MISVSGVYLRVDVDVTSYASIDMEPVHVRDSSTVPQLTFVDLFTSLRRPYTDAYSERLTAAIQDRLHLISNTDRILFRWPWLAGPKPQTQHNDEIGTWIARLTSSAGGEPVIAPDIQVGVIQHRVTGDPMLQWTGERPSDEQTVLTQARSIELLALLNQSNAIWEPPTYHYRLPSGEHTDVFIRLADAIKSPQDAYVLATWVCDRLRIGAGIIVDTGGLTPLLIQIESFLSRFELDIGPSVILSEYPAGRSTVRRTVENAIGDLSRRVICILSVSSTGSLLCTLIDELERLSSSSTIDYKVDVLVDRAPKTGPSSDMIQRNHNVLAWLSYERAVDSDPSGSCKFCRSAEKSQFIAVDPRTYGTMSLPGPHLVMPAVGYATDGQLFWKRVSECRGLAIEVNPSPTSRVARGKRLALPVRPIFELICKPEGLRKLVKERIRTLEIPDGLAQTKLVVTIGQDVGSVQIPSFMGEGEVNFGESIREVLEGLGCYKHLSFVTTANKDELRSQVAKLDQDDAILVFTWGSVTGLTLRRLKVAVAEVLRSQPRDVTVNGLVFHSRPSTPDEWTALQNQFRPGSLVDLWTSCFPWASPMSEEYRLLDRSDLGNLRSAVAKRFLDERMEFLTLHSTYSDYEDDWSPRFVASDDQPHPEHVFWGMSRGGIHQERVRGRSLYGQDLDVVTAYAAIGAVINHTRLSARPAAAPRWVMFDLGRIVRSYFDAVIICSMLRWLNPGELWWGTEFDDAESIRDSVSFLLDSAADKDEQVLLVPELLLASAQGKVPALAHETVRDRARRILAGWPVEERYAMPRGAVEVGLALLDRG